MSCIYIYIYLPLLLSWQKQKSLSHLYPPKRMCYFEPGRLWCGDQGGNAKGYGMVTFAEISCGYECHLIFYVHLLCQCDSVWEEWGDGHIYPECVFFQMLNFRSWKSWFIFTLFLMMNLIERHQNALLKAHIYGTKWQWFRKRQSELGTPHRAVNTMTATRSSMLNFVCQVPGGLLGLLRSI